MKFSFDDFNRWFKQYTKKDVLRLKKLGYEFLDEVNMLLEQIKDGCYLPRSINWRIVILM